MKKRFFAILTFSLVFFVALSAGPAFAEKKASPDSPVHIDFENVDIRVFIKFISELTGRNFLIDNKVRGNITIVSPGPINLKEAYNVFQTVLNVYGFTTVESGKLTKIIPVVEARRNNIEMKQSLKMRGTPTDQIITQIIRLKYADVEKIKRLFAPLITQGGMIMSYDDTDMLLLADSSSNISRLIKILKLVDVPSVGREISIFPVKYATASDLTKILQGLFSQQKPDKRSLLGTESRFISDARTNSIITLATKSNTRDIKKMIVKLDKEVPKGSEKIRVYYLENASAEKLVGVLKALSQKKASGKSPLIGQDVVITADKSTNSLIVVAEQQDYKVLEEIVQKLDMPRSMVYIECLIMEVDIDKEFKLGAEWAVGDTTTIGGKSGAYGAGFSANSYASSANLVATGSLPAGFSMGIFGETLSIGDVKFPNLTALIQAYKTDEATHILQTPQILTLNNEEAKIVIAENIPYTTTAGVGTDAANAYEYKDVGVTLKITPQISKGRTINLKIEQNVSQVDSQATKNIDSITLPTTKTRDINTTVLVKDGSTVVIGGLIGDNFSDSRYKVPCLGDIPFLGVLFRSKSTGSKKTNLYVFLTPRIVESDDEAVAIYSEKKRHIDAIQESTMKLYDDDNRNDGIFRDIDGLNTPPSLDLTQDADRDGYYRARPLYYNDRRSGKQNTKFVPKTTNPKTAANKKKANDILALPPSPESIEEFINSVKSNKAIAEDPIPMSFP